MAITVTRKYNTYTWMDGDKQLCSANFIEKEYIGFSGKQLKREPSSSSRYFSLPAWSMLRSAYVDVYFADPNEREAEKTIIERLFSLGIYNRIYFYKPTFAIENWKRVLKTIKELLEIDSSANIDFSLVYTAMEKKGFFETIKNLNLSKDDKEKLFRDYKEYPCIPIKNLIRFLKHSHKEDEILEELQARYHNFSINRNYLESETKYSINRLLKENSDLILPDCDDVVSVKKQLIAQVEADVRKEYFNHHDKEKFFFENDDYKIHIPNTYEELVGIGDFFHNCSAGWEWENRLKSIDYYLVVAMPKKANLEPLCIDFTMKNLLHWGRQMNQYRISQYYTKCNDTPKSKEAEIFRKEYQNYLDSLIEKEN